MSAIVIGKSGNHNVSIDLRVLLETRMLVTADSGGGKTFLLKRLCEQLFGKVPILIVDPEGEFAPLREKFGFVLCGKGGETPAHPRSAALVAHKFLELQASAICDIYEMKPAARHEWVRLFVEALIEAPKNLRHPTIVLIDEAHMFCPEKGKGESEASESVKDLATRGRKRGLCAIFATQRLATLNKDASGMLGNRLIGPTFEDVNVKRAIEIMSVSNEHQREFKQAIKVLEPGNFYALGRAISKDRILLKVGAIETPHGSEAMKYAEVPPPAPDAIAKLLPKLSDLPKAAEEKAKTEAELRTEIRALKMQLKSQPVPAAAPSVEWRRQYERLNSELALAKQRVIDLEGHATAVRNYAAQKENVITALTRSGKRFVDEFASVVNRLTIEPLKMPEVPPRPKVSGREIQTKESPTSKVADAVTSRPAANHPRPDIIPAEAGDLNQAQLKILQALMHLEAVGTVAPSREQVAFWSGAPPTSGAFKENVGDLKTRGLVLYPRPGIVVPSEAGRAAIDSAAFSDEDAFQAGLALLSDAQRKILDELISAYPSEMDRATLAERAGVPVTSGGFKENVSDMRTAGLIEYPAAGTVKCVQWLLRS